MSDDNNLPKPIALVIGVITSIIAFITAVVGFILLWQGNAKIVSTVVIAIGIIGLWASLLYIRLSKKPGHHYGRHISSDRKKRLEGFSFSENVRRWSLIGLYTIPLIVLFLIAIYFYRTNQPQSSITVLVADFDGPDPKKYGVTQFFADKIQQTVAGLDYVSIRTLNQTITASQGNTTADEVGRQNKGNIILWGWYVVSNQKISVTYHLRTLSSDFGLGLKGPSDWTQNLQAPINDVQTFDFQSKELTNRLIVDTLENVSISLVSLDKIPEAIGNENIVLNYISSQQEGFANANNTKAENLSILGDFYGMENRYDLAIQLSNQAIDLNKSFETYHNRAQIYGQMQNYSTVITDEEIALTLTSTSANKSAAYSSIGQAYLKQNRFLDATQALSQGLNTMDSCTLLSNCHMLHFMRGISYLKLGNKTAAKADFDVVKNLTKDEAISNYLDTLLRK